MVGFIVGLGLVVIAVGLLQMSWLASQDRLKPGGRLGFHTSSTMRDDASWREGHRAAAVPLGVTAGIVGFAGIGVMIGGFDVLGASAAILSMAAVSIGVLVARRTAEVAAGRVL